MGGKTFNLVLRVCLWLWGAGRERERPWEQERWKIKADFAGASALDSSLNDSHFAAHAWDSKVSLLTDYLFTEDEKQCRDFWEGLEASWSSWIEENVITQATGPTSNIYLLK